MLRKGFEGGERQKNQRFPRAIGGLQNFSHPTVIFYLRVARSGRKSPLTGDEETLKGGTDYPEAATKIAVSTIWRQDGRYARSSGVLHVLFSRSLKLLFYEGICGRFGRIGV